MDPALNKERNSDKSVPTLLWCLFYLLTLVLCFSGQRREATKASEVSPGPVGAGRLHKPSDTGQTEAQPVWDSGKEISIKPIHVTV